MTTVSDLPRVWPTIRIPGVAERPRTYWMLDLDAMPPIEASLDGSLGWLMETPARTPSLDPAVDDSVVRAADGDGLRAVARGASLSTAFTRFIEDPSSRRHIRSATACYLDLGQFAVRLADHGSLIHFLSDEQWVVHWLLWLRSDGTEAVVATPEPLGFDLGEGEPIDRLDLNTLNRSLGVCGDSFEQFLYHFWAMNELFYLLAVDKVPLDALPGTLRRYAERYPRCPSADEIFE